MRVKLGDSNKKPPLRWGPLGSATENIVGGTLALAGSGDHKALVFPEHLGPALDVGGTVVDGRLIREVDNTGDTRLK